MTGRRLALVIANGDYDHPSLQRLRSPAADAASLVAVLGEPTIADFEVTVVSDAAAHEILGAIEDRLTEVRPDDLVLLHFSGHGLKDESGALYLAARNTRPDRLGSTAVPAEFIQRAMNACRARRLVLLLDCCYGGAFGRGVRVRAAGSANVMESFGAARMGGGRGRAVISASSSMEFAFEGTSLDGDEQPPSVFTDAVITGLRTGAADLDGDGLITLDELYDYVFDRVRALNPRQSPTRRIDLEGDLVLATSVLGPRPGAVEPRPVPAPVRTTATAASELRWASTPVLTATASLYALAAVLLTAAVLLPIRYGRSMLLESLDLVPITVAGAVLAAVTAVLLASARRRPDPGSVAVGYAWGTGASAVNLAATLLWALSGNEGFGTVGMASGLAGCLAAATGTAVVTMGVRRRRPTELWAPSSLRTGFGVALATAGVVGATGLLLQLASTTPWPDEQARVWSFAVTALLSLLVPPLSAVLTQGAAGLRTAWTITLASVIIETMITFDAGGVWGNGHAYRIADTQAFGLGILLLGSSLLILLVAPAVRRWLTAGDG